MPLWPKKKSWKNCHFWTKTMGWPLRKNGNFSSFQSFCFYSLERRFFVLKYRKRNFSGLYCLKKKLEKWPFLDQNYGLTPLKKCNLSTFQSTCFYSLERRFFKVYYRKRHFPCLYWLKRKVRKMAIFVEKPWVNSIGKMSIFLLFEVFVFISQKGVFSF